MESPAEAATPFCRHHVVLGHGGGVVSDGTHLPPQRWADNGGWMELISLGTTPSVRDGMSYIVSEEIDRLLGLVDRIGHISDGTYACLSV